MLSSHPYRSPSSVVFACVACVVLVECKELKLVSGALYDVMKLCNISDWVDNAFTNSTRYLKYIAVSLRYPY